MSYAHLVPTPDVGQDRRRSRQFSAIVPIQAPGQQPVESTSGFQPPMLSPPSDPRVQRSQPHFQPDARALRPHAPAMWSRPLLDPENRGAAFRQFSQSPVGSQYPRSVYPEVMDFNEYECGSSTGISSPTPDHRMFHHPVHTATIVEVPDDVDSLEMTAPVTPVYTGQTMFVAPSPTSIGSRPHTAPPTTPGPIDKGKGKASGGQTPDPTAQPPTNLPSRCR